MEPVKSWIAQGNLSALIDKTNQMLHPILISSANSNSVLVGEHEWKEIRFSFKPKIRIKWNGKRVGTILIFLSKAISLLHQNLTDKTTEQLPAQLASKVLQLGG